MSLGDEEGHHRKKRKHVVKTEEEGSEDDDDDDDEDWDESKDRDATTIGGEAGSSSKMEILRIAELW